MAFRLFFKEKESLPLEPGETAETKTLIFDSDILTALCLLITSKQSLIKVKS
jgi:hypothetical protein